MDVVNLILLGVIAILVIGNKTSMNQKFENLESRIMELKELLDKAKLRNDAPERPKDAAPGPIPVKPPPDIVKPSVEPPKPIAPPPRLVEKEEPVIERQAGVITDKVELPNEPITAGPPQRRLKEPEPELSFFERYPDLEKFIGENLVNKIGIAILVLAIGFFVKYAIDNEWIGRWGRVAIGIFCGAILVGFAHRMRNSYKAFSSVLVGGGIAIFYFTITLAFQEFHLFSQLVALVILIGITVFAVALSLLYDKQELAVIALIGGFASPFMVSNGSNNYSGLFLYLLILNAGLLIIAYYKAWRILNITSFVLSVIVFASVLVAMPATAYYIAFRYATVFYLLFFTINIINNVRENKTFIGSDFSILLTNTALYFGTGLFLLTAMGQTQYRGLFSAGLGALNLVLSYILFRNRKVDPNVLYLLIGITLTFISLTAPIQLHGNNITLFWASETVLIYWLYQKSKINLMKLTSLLVWGAMIISLLMDLMSVYSNSGDHIAIITNKGFITTLVAAISSYLLYLLAKRDNDGGDSVTTPKNVYRVMAFVLLFCSGLLETNHQFEYFYPGTGVNIVYDMLYVSVFAYAFIFITAKIRASENEWKINIGLAAVTIGVHLMLSMQYFDLLGAMLEHKKISTSLFFAHWISDVFVGLLFYQLISLCRDHLREEIKNAITWVLSASVVLFISLELCLLSERLFYTGVTPLGELQTVYIKTGLPIIWGMASFILMWLGMRNKQRNLRIISLTLFLVTLIKLFLFDINNIPVAGKIAAFFCLGILLLIISFMYQKVKKIIVDDEAKEKE